MDILSVTQLNNLIKAAFDNVPALQNVCVRGEISNYKLYPSGHHYFSLKDTEGSLKCVLFKGSAFGLRFRPANGMSVLAVGRVSVYPRDGVYQLYCTRLLPEGIGDLQIAFEQLRRRLEAEGIFDPERKKPLPAYPHRIGIVTSPAGAAIHDMLRILGKRYPLSRVILIPVRVQGETAAGEIAEAIDLANALQLADVLIVGRGGGSMEDLWAFNEEVVARAISRSRIPVVSAVGHEPDVTISDYAADLRAATPSNAAELIAPDQFKLRAELLSQQQAMNAALRKRLERARERLTALAGSPALQSPLNSVQERRVRLDLISERLRGASGKLLHQKKQDYLRLTAALNAMNPLAVLQRGYSLTTDARGNPVSSVREVNPKQRLRIALRDGVIRATATSVEEMEHEGTFNEL